MPTLPLYTPGAAPDASHQIVSPGGYEHWTFAAEDVGTDTQITATLAHGFAFHPGYLRADARYRRRPTRVAPPAPADYACVSFAVYVGGHRMHRSIALYPPTVVSAVTDRLDVRIGPNFCRRGDDGRIHLVLGGKSKASAGRIVTAEMEFTPRAGHAPVERRLMLADRKDADHLRVVADAFCGVAGTFRMEGGEHSLPFDGRGYCAHHYGSAPIARELDRWMWGTAAFSARSYTFELARPRDPSRPEDVQLLRCDTTGVHEIRDAPVTFQGSRRAGLLLSYPSEMNVGNELRLSSPRVVDQSLFSLRIQYVAANGAGRETTRAFCEVAYPQRLRWPVLGRLIERSIDRVGGEVGRSQRCARAVRPLV